jgi:hypothetical protein
MHAEAALALFLPTTVPPAGTTYPRFIRLIDTGWYAELMNQGL